MNPLIKIKSVSNSSSSSGHSLASLTFLPLNYKTHHDLSCCFLTLNCGLSAVAFLRPQPDSPTLARSLEILQSGQIELPAELCAVLLVCLSGQEPSKLREAEDLEILNLLGNAKVQQSATEDSAAKIKRLLADWESECCAVYSVLGSILSQEVVTFIKDPSLVRSGWLVVDGLAGTAQIVSVTESDISTANC